MERKLSDLSPVADLKVGETPVHNASLVEDLDGISDGAGSPDHTDIPRRARILDGNRLESRGQCVVPVGVLLHTDFETVTLRSDRRGGMRDWWVSRGRCFQVVS